MKEKLNQGLLVFWLVVATITVFLGPLSVYSLVLGLICLSFSLLPVTIGLCLRGQEV